MFKNKLKSALLALSALLVIGGAVFAQEQKPSAPATETKRERKMMKRDGTLGRPGKAGRRGRHAQGGGQALRQLNLTDAQREQLRGLAQSNRQNDAALHTEARQLLQQKRAGTLDANGQARLEQMQSQLKAQREARESQLLAVLTPEQKAQLEQFKEQRTLNLTDAQKQQMKSLHERARQQSAGSHEEMRQLMQQKRAGTLDANGQARLEQLHTQFKANREAQHNEFLNLLTLEQKAKLEQMQQNRRGQRRNRN